MMVALVNLRGDGALQVYVWGMGEWWLEWDKWTQSMANLSLQMSHCMATVWQMYHWARGWKILVWISSTWIVLCFVGFITSNFTLASRNKYMCLWTIFFSFCKSNLLNSIWAIKDVSNYPNFPREIILFYHSW